MNQRAAEMANPDESRSDLTISGIRISAGIRLSGTGLGHALRIRVFEQ
jgi:hypothetical protein